MAGLFFNSQKLPAIRGEYVMWCDGMGTGRVLSVSIAHAANFIFKLHTAFDEALAQYPTAHAYPLMDGMYITSPSRTDLQSIIRSAYSRLSDEFVNTDDFNKRFLVRAGIAYGATLHGSDVPDDAFIHGIDTQFEEANRKAFASSRLNQTRMRLLLASQMVAAYKSEPQSPPFGVFVHDTAINVPQLVNTKDRGFFSRLWRWWSPGDGTQKLAEQLISYFNEADRRTHELDYPRKSIEHHRRLTEEYFAEFLPHCGVSGAVPDASTTSDDEIASTV